MLVKKLEEAGYVPAMLGLQTNFKNYGKDMTKVAEKLAPMGRGHNKFLRQIFTWWQITAPIYWWVQADQYKTGGVTTQSESTMHTLLKSEITQKDFDKPLTSSQLDYLNFLRCKKDLLQLKNDLPTGYLQSRVIVANYQTLATMIEQRANHKLPHWQDFIKSVLAQVEHPELLPSFMEINNG